MTYKIIGICIETNTLELVGKDSKRYYLKIPSHTNAYKKFKNGQRINGSLNKICL